MAEQVDRRTDATRQQILRAAAKQFAVKPYGLVNLDDILLDAAVTKGAMYHHFRSKYALASAIVDQWLESNRRIIDDTVALRHSGMETLVDIVFAIALRDIGDPATRAGLNLLESVGRTDGLRRRAFDASRKALTPLALRAIENGDAAADRTPEDIARVLVYLYLGVRQANDPGDAAAFLGDLHSAWTLVLPGLAASDRLGYLTTFVRRRSALAIKKAAPLSTDTL
ncbi:TetR family transcriptional regulator [Mycolicibacterium litorale]|uniref:TetR family transcriptional regulator n=1 Tax=Mycolicibacterium litorale TaxID=758802 RepID=A0AAD1MTS3_9MYCO|nr:TetR family transcriptional regulator [Mycolicibacterium litorale]MCV7415750.1 TetR family transcriptional regulator [Mycolicibacterium litorale]TDY09004.1 TetR family transcriptional regulator [Mycolicibacterium litorale]BBY16935.1 TetR family transcriptional regulator [Mycolicibacterium litorale]